MLVDAPLAPVFDFHQEQRALATLVVDDEESTDGKGVVEVDPSGRVRRFAEKQPPAARRSTYRIADPVIDVGTPTGRALANAAVGDAV